MDILHKFDDELPIAFSEEMGYNILENQKTFPWLRVSQVEHGA